MILCESYVVFALHGVISTRRLTRRTTCQFSGLCGVSFLFDIIWLAKTEDVNGFVKAIVVLNLLLKVRRFQHVVGFYQYHSRFQPSFPFSQPSANAATASAQPGSAAAAAGTVISRNQVRPSSGDTFTSPCTHALNYPPLVWSPPTYPTGHQQTVGRYRDTAPEPDAEQGKPLPTAPTPVPLVPTTTMPHTPSPRQPQPLTQTTAPPPPAGAFVI